MLACGSRSAVISSRHRKQIFCPSMLIRSWQITHFSFPVPEALISLDFRFSSSHSACHSDSTVIHPPVPSEILCVSPSLCL